MAKKFASKALKVTGMSMGLMVGTMVAGAGLATAGWWYTDRLNVAGMFGEQADINRIGMADESKNCKPGAKGTNTYTDETGTHTQTLECDPNAHTYTYDTRGTKAVMIEYPDRIVAIKTQSGVKYATAGVIGGYGVQVTGPTWRITDDKVTAPKATPKPIKPTPKRSPSSRYDTK